ncbi:S-adenosyl-L-methionine-dependent methyltransferase [Xylogone sp. PMI_703]|nr:S-adenosyl-L-methionine-dependent methyltransferase [Xylogone sp. PMI_703]
MDSGGGCSNYSRGLQGNESSPEDEEPFPTTLEVDDEVGDGLVMDFDDDDIRSIAARSFRLRSSSKSIFRRPQSDQDTLNSTRSLYDSDLIYTSENGRIYCRDYYLPIDDDELDRQRISHQVHLNLLQGSPTTVNLTAPTKILDIGTGTGDWAMEMGDLYPSAEVIGTDIAKIQPSAVPLNVFFEIDNAEEEDGWTWPENEFDLVHLRNMSGAFMDWKHIYREAFACLRPGGWIEVCDFDDHGVLRSFFGPESYVIEFLNAFATASVKSGRPRSSSHLKPAFLEDLNFVDVKVTEYEIPMGIWPEDEEERGAMALRLLTKELGWDPERVRKLCENASREVKTLALDPENSKGLVFKSVVIVGRKPLGYSASVETHQNGITASNQVEVAKGREKQRQKNTNIDTQEIIEEMSE